MRITIRLDDITADMNCGNFNRIKTMLDAHDIKPIIGVVPDCKDSKLKIENEKENFWHCIKKLQEMGWTVAMHGLNHLYTTKDGGVFPLNRKSEFAGLGFEVQDKMIREGKEILKSHGIETDIFMAPSHSYDKNTLKALKKNGFNKITDGFGTKPYKRDGIIFYPISFNRSMSLKSKSDGITTFVYHANTMDDNNFETMEKLFERADVVSYSEFDRIEARPRFFVGNIIEFAMANFKYFMVKRKR